MKYEFLSLFAGICCKLYDDLDDNELLSWLKTPFIMELLKGLHYVSFTCISLHNAAFFYFNYFTNLLHFVFNSIAFSKPYERSLWFTLGLLFFIVNPIDSSFHLCFIDKLYIFSTSSTMLLEPLFCVDDISTYKFIFRSLLIFGNLVIYFLFNTQLSDFVKCIIFYAVGYVSVSSIVQYYSLFVANKNIPPMMVPEEKA